MPVLRFVLQAAPLPPSFRGTPQQFFDAMLDRMEFVSDGDVSTFLIADSLPSTDQGGPILLGGSKWYVWDTDPVDETGAPISARYVPLDISDSYKTQFYIGNTEPPLMSNDVPRWQYWLKTAAGKLIGSYRWIDATTGWVAQTPKNEYYVDTGDADAFEIARTPTATSYELGDRYQIRAENPNTGSATLKVDGLAAVTIKKMTEDGLVNLAAGNIQAGQIFEVVYDGSVFQVVSRIIETKVAPPSGVQVYTAGSGNFTVPDDVYVLDVEVVGAGGGGGANAGGGGGGYAYKRLAVMPGQIIPYVVGAGGHGEDNAPQSNGGDSSFTLSVIANGGKCAANGGDGGSYTGADFGVAGTDHNYEFGSAGDKPSGGLSAFPGSHGGILNGATTRTPRLGGGGYGDSDAGGGYSGQDGAAGLILVKW